MKVNPLAGKPAPESILANIPRLVTDYYAFEPDPSESTQKVAFGTSGHRGTSLERSFNEEHILAITQAICLHRRQQGIDGPVFIGIDTHALSEPAFATALEVLAANEVDVMIDDRDSFTPTPVVSHAILGYNRQRSDGMADGIVITPSHNPPEDGGFKYDPPNGGPADVEATRWIQDRANELLRVGDAGVKRVPYAIAFRKSTTHEQDFVLPYVRDLGNVVDMDVIREAGLELGVDPLGGASKPVWEAIGPVHEVSIAIVNPAIDPTFSFMTVDHDGKIRTDPSSPYAMARVVALKDDFRVVVANDADADRHGVVTRSAGLLNPNDYLTVAIHYLLTHRPRWPAHAMVGKTVVSSSMIDRVVEKLGRRLYEVPVGFKWFVPGLFDGSCCFGGEESAGASFLRRDATVWATDKDGVIMDLLAAEITAATGKDPGEHYKALEAELGTSYYRRIDAPASAEEKARLKTLAPEAVRDETLAGDPITAKLTRAKGNGAPIDGLKIVTASGWFAARPSGTESVYKIYAESFRSASHLDALLGEAQDLVDTAIGGSK